MRPLSFENLRRLVGGKKKKKKDDSGFRRSDSFKRISIRKSYLDRGKKKNLSKLEVATQTVPEEELSKIFTATCKVDSAIQVDRDESFQNTYMELPIKKTVLFGNKNTLIPNCTTKDSSLSSFGGKGSERTVIYVPASDDSLSPPIIEEISCSPTPRRRQSHAGILERKESNDSAVEMFPWGDSVDIKKSPLMRDKAKVNCLPSLMPTDSGNEEMCSLSISLGRIWMDAPRVMSPRSLEIPRNIQNKNNSLAHNSLDSALRDNRVVPNCFQKRQMFSVSRTSSSNSNSTNSTGLLSSRDSGLSFSVPTSGFGDFKMTSGFLNKQPKPKLSVSREGYFRRTSEVSSEHRNSVRRKSSRKKKCKLIRGNKRRSCKRDMYQVVVGRRPRQLSFLRLDPMIFVPPERRKPSMKRKKSFRTEICEIRNFKPTESIYVGIDTTSDDDMYESLPGDLDLELWEDGRSEDGLVSRYSSRDEDVFSPDREESSESDDDSIDSRGDSERNKFVSRASSATKTRPVKRKKSIGISRKRNATFVVRPTIVRAPSTLRRPSRRNGEFLLLNICSRKNFFASFRFIIINFVLPINHCSIENS